MGEPNGLGRPVDSIWTHRSQMMPCISWPRILGIWTVMGLVCFSPLQAGIYLKSESWNDLPCQWKGWLLDHRQLLRCQSPIPGSKPTEMRSRLENIAKGFKQKKDTGPLGPDDLAEWGGVLLRLGRPEEALGVLQGAQRAHPQHFRLTSHLCQAWCATGQWTMAQALSVEAVRLAPGRWLAAEELMARLIRSRISQPPDRLDRLFTTPWDGLFESLGKGQPWEKANSFSPNLTADLQRVALWFPTDGRLLAQTGVLCAALGDVHQAALILEGAVSEFGVRDPLVMKLRFVCKDQASKPGNHTPKGLVQKYRSARPLEDTSPLPSYAPPQKGVRTEVPWIVFTKTKMSPKHDPEFPNYLKSLAGTDLTVEGYLQPFGENIDSGNFLLVENAVGCWWCEMPDLTGMIRVELGDNQPLPALRRLVEVRGKLRLNATNPESHLFFLDDAVVIARE